MSSLADAIKVAEEHQQRTKFAKLDAEATLAIRRAEYELAERIFFELCGLQDEGAT
jgi:hypothetical protein